MLLAIHEQVKADIWKLVLHSFYVFKAQSKEFAVLNGLNRKSSNAFFAAFDDRVVRKDGFYEGFFCPTQQNVCMPKMISLLYVDIRTIFKSRKYKSCHSIN